MHKITLIVVVIAFLIGIIIFLPNSNNNPPPETPPTEPEPTPEPIPNPDKLGGYCGTSTFTQCETNSDCITGGCSGQYCQSVSEEQIISTCEWLECYNTEEYGVSCGCINKKCQWHK